MESRLRDEQRQMLVEQFVEALDKSQDSYDSSIRALSSAGVAATVSLGVALESFGNRGLAAVIAFLVSLAANLGTYATAKRDLRKRIEDLWAGRDEGAEGNNWTKVTGVGNSLAGVTLLIGGALLALFIASST